MRDIIFRGKWTGNGEWLYGSLIYDSINNITRIVEFPLEDVINLIRISSTEIDEETIGQYTGIQDDNNCPIFESDILQFTYTGQGKGAEERAVVIFKDGAFGVEWGWHKEFVHLKGFANTKIEVIGNIHDDLMED